MQLTNVIVRFDWSVLSNVLLTPGYKLGHLFPVVSSFLGSLFPCWFVSVGGELPLPLDC